MSKDENKKAYQLFGDRFSQELESLIFRGDKPKPAQEKRLAFYSKAFEPNYDYITLDMRETLSQDDYIIVGNEAQVLTEYRRIKRVLGCQLSRERKGYWKFEYAGRSHSLTYWQFHQGDYAIYGRIVKPEWKFELDWKRNIFDSPMLWRMRYGGIK